MENSGLEILNYNFNQNNSCITIGTEEEFKIYKLNPNPEICINRSK